MSNNVNIRISESGSRKVAGGFRRIDKSMSKVGRTSQRVARSMARGFGRVGGAVGRLGGILGGLGVAVGGKALLAFDDVLGQLQADTGMTTAAAKKMRAEFLKISKDVGISKDQVAAAAQEWQDYTGVLKQMMPQMGNLAKIHKATGTPMKQLATISAALMNSLGLKPKGAIDALARLNEQSRAGAINMKKAAAVLPELLAAGSGYGFKGQRGTKQMGTLLQTAGAAYGGKAAEAKTGAVALMRDLTKNAKKLKKMKVNVFDPKDPKKMRDIDKIMSEIMKKTGGAIAGKKGLGQIFTEESIKTALAFKQAKSIKRVQAAGERGSMGTIQTQLNKKVTGVAAESEKLKKALAGLDAAFQTHGKAMLTWAAKNPMLAAGAAAGGYGALKLGGGILGRLLKGKGGIEGLVKAGGSKGLPVYVTNMGGLGGGNKIPDTMKKPSLGKKALKTGLGLAPGIGAGGALLAVGIGAGAGIAANAVGSAAALKKQKMISQQATAEHGQRGVAQRLASQAGTLAGLGKKGVGTYGAKGNKQALNQANVLATLKASAQRQGATDATFAAILPVLKQLTAALGKGTTVKVVAPGIDGATVVSSRNP